MKKAIAGTHMQAMASIIRPMPPATAALAAALSCPLSPAAAAPPIIATTAKIMHTKATAYPPPINARNIVFETGFITLLKCGCLYLFLHSLHKRKLAGARLFEQLDHCGIRIPCRNLCRRAQQSGFATGCPYVGVGA